VVSKARRSPAQPGTLTIDIGGTGIKLLPVDDDGQPLADLHRELTPKPATREAVLNLIAEKASKQAPFRRVSVPSGLAGAPGVCARPIRWLSWRMPATSQTRRM